MRAKQLKSLLLFVALCFGVTLYTNSQEKKHESKNINPVDQIVKQFKSPSDSSILVAAHRGDWRNAPENSLQAIQNCIEMGVDIVEIDVQMTKDSVLVLMHDNTIDRTTNGHGAVNSLTYDSLQHFWLVDGLHHTTPNKIPTLKDALLLAKGKILLNLDKSYELFDQCYTLLIKTGTLNQAIIKGAKPRQEVESAFGKYLGKLFFMPIIRLTDPNAKQILDDYLAHKIPVAFEFTVPSDTSSIIKDFGKIREKGAGVWVNSLWPEHNAGHDDEKAVINNSVYDWYIENKINIIQTDRPALLLKYLRKKGLHH